MRYTDILNESKGDFSNITFKTRLKPFEKLLYGSAITFMLKKLSLNNVEIIIKKRLEKLGVVI